MVANPERREALADAGLQVLAADGARGLTHRAVDKAAAVPEGTTANYFRTRDDLLGALATRVFERLAPDPARIEELSRLGRGIDASTGYIADIVDRTTGSADVMRALFELRLEAVRRPALRATLGATLQENFRLDAAFNADAGLPGGTFEIALLHFALDGLIFDRITTSIGDGFDTDAIVAEIVKRLLVPTGDGSGQSRQGG